MTHCGDCGVELTNADGGHQFCPLCLDVYLRRFDQSEIEWQLQHLENQFAEDLFNEGSATS